MSKVATAELQAQMLTALQALAPATDAAPIVPSDSADLAQEAVGIACGGNAGSVKLRTAAGNDRTIAIAAGQTIGIRFRKVYLTGTSATGLTALFNAAAIVSTPTPPPTPTPAPQPALTLSSAVIKAEGNSGTMAFTWTLTLNRDGSTAAYPFAWAVAGSGSNPANAADFGGTLPSGTATFAAGETTKTITVLVTGDTAVEPDEAFTLTVTASGLNTVTSSGTISNDDAAPSLTLTPTSASIDTLWFQGRRVAAITGVPSGVTPTISPGDGRFVIAGSEAAGWYIARGLSAISAGTVNIAISASGATGASMDLPIAAPTASMLPYEPLFMFESLGTAVPGAGSTLSLDTSSRRAQGTAAFRTQGTNLNNTSMGFGPLFTTTRDLANDDILLIFVDLGDFLENAVGSIRPSISAGGKTYSYTNDPGAAHNVPYTGANIGKRCLGFRLENFKNAGVSVKTVGAVSKTFSINAATAGAGSINNHDVVVDAMVIPSKAHRSALIISADDANASIYTHGFEFFKRVGLVGNLYIPMDIIDTSGRLTTAQILEMKAAGWGICVDSEANDLPLVAQPTLQAARSALKSNRDRIAAAFGSEGCKHMCWSYNNAGHQQGPRSYAATSNGAAQTTLSGVGTNVFSNLVPGERVFVGSETTPRGKVLRLLSQSSAQLDFQLPAGSYSGSTALRFVNRIFNVAITADGSNVVTATNGTTNMIEGQTLIALGLDGVKIAAGGIDAANSRLTLTGPVPSTVKAVDLGFVEDDYWPSTVVKALRDDEYLSGRQSTNTTAVFNGYGSDPLQLLEHKGIVHDNNTMTDTVIAQMWFNAREGADSHLYGHQFYPQDIWVCDASNNPILPLTINWSAHWPKIALAAQAIQASATPADNVSWPQWELRQSFRLPIQ